MTYAKLLAEEKKANAEKAKLAKANKKSKNSAIVLPSIGDPVNINVGLSLLTCTIAALLCYICWISPHHMTRGEQSRIDMAREEMELTDSDTRGSSANREGYLLDSIFERCANQSEDNESKYMYRNKEITHLNSNRKQDTGALKYGVGSRKLRRYWSNGRYSGAGRYGPNVNELNDNNSFSDRFTRNDRDNIRNEIMGKSNNIHGRNNRIGKQGKNPFYRTYNNALLSRDKKSDLYSPKRNQHVNQFINNYNPTDT